MDGYSNGFTTAPQNLNARQIDINLINQILSTFKFIDKKDISTWKTYRNDEYGFEFKYPGSWSISPRTDGINLSKGTDIKNINFELTNNRDRIDYVQQENQIRTYNLAEKNWQAFYHKENNPGELGDFRDTIALITIFNDKSFIIRLTPEDDLALDSEFNQILSTFRLVE